MIGKRSLGVALLLLLCGTMLHAQRPPVPSHLEIKFVRDSAEYALLTRQVFQAVTSSVTEAARTRSSGPWVVVMDVDETALDNSVYLLERAAYGLPFESVSWKAWVLRARSAAVPGVVDFVAAVRRAGGRVAWITNRDEDTRDATRANLRDVGLWNDNDRLCPQSDSGSSKRERRAEVVGGTGPCGWSGEPQLVAAFVGDQMRDFPVADEKIPGTGTDAAFGRTCFLIPNPMYGDWVAAGARATPAPVR
jgi:5'-nucleotidase (lipoprotein e(P4) family)